MARLLASIATVALCVFLGACGATGRNTHPNGADESAKGGGGATMHRYLNDGDAEKLDDHDNDNEPGSNHDDGDADSSEEYEETFDNGDYHDSDDASILSYGHPATAAVTQQVAAVVRRYYQAAAAEDGAKACAMLTPTLAAGAASSYGGAIGPVYLRGAKSCTVVMSRLFAHYRGRITAAIAVTAVRVEGEAALALVGSRTMPAGDIRLNHEDGAWRVTNLIGSPLP